MALKAAFLYEVTIFQPNRPPVRWSSVEKRLANKKGGSNEVEEVIAKDRFLVTAAMAEMGFDGEMSEDYRLEGFNSDLQLMGLSWATAQHVECSYQGCLHRYRNHHMCLPRREH
jgi:hypothetical protein